MTQREALSEAEKQLIYEKRCSGKKIQEISQEMYCSIETVRKWLRNRRAGKGKPARGRPKRGAASTYPSKVREQAIEMKKAHPHWGPKKILVELQDEAGWQAAELPSPSQLALLFQACCPEAIQAHQRRHLPPNDPHVYEVHQRWEMDAKEGIVLGEQRVTVQEIRDVYSGLMIASQSFAVPASEKGWQHLHREDHQQVLRQAFSQWGLPLEVQTDNDTVFHQPGDPSFPTLFTLWLVGLGITHVLSRPHRPTDQAHVERNHRTQANFVWNDQSFPNLEAFQKALDHHRQSYNQNYPSQATHCHGHPPLSAFPTAVSTGRPYHPDLEWSFFDLSRVDAFLASCTWIRTVAANGVVHLGDQYYILGRDWKPQSVSIRFLLPSRCFRFQSSDGSSSIDFPAIGLSKDQIIGSIPAHFPLHAGFQFSFPFVGV